jgi:signal transduction histidine kinase
MCVNWGFKRDLAAQRDRGRESCVTFNTFSIQLLVRVQEAAGHVKDLESALREVQILEQQRADLWRQAAHDLRGNLGVVANATVGLTQGGLREASRDAFVRILMRNVTSLHHLLNDVTDLARLQAGREQRHLESIDVSPILQQLCEGIRPLAQQLYNFGTQFSSHRPDGSVFDVRVGFSRSRAHQAVGRDRP